MSLYNYKISLEISASDPPFAALIMSAIRKADTVNLGKLRMLYPEIYGEFHARYFSDEGGLPEDGTQTTD